MDHRLKVLEEKRKGLRKFCWSFGAGMAILTTVLLWHSGWVVSWYHFIPLGLSAFHLLAAILFPPLGKPIHLLVGFIGLLLSTILIGAFYYLLFTPVVLLLRLAGKDLIANNSQQPHWEKVSAEENDPQRIRKLY